MIKRLHPIFLGVKSFYFAYLFLQNSQKRLVIMLLGCVKMAIVKNIKNKIKIPKKNLKNIILYSKRVLWGVIAFLLCFLSCNLPHGKRKTYCPKQGLTHRELLRIRRESSLI